MRYDFETDENIRLIDAVHDNQRIVTDVCHGISSLARAFARTGNAEVAEELYGYIDPLMQSAKQVAAPYSIDLNGQLRHGEEMTAGLLAIAIKTIVPNDG